MTLSLSCAEVKHFGIFKFSCLEGTDSEIYSALKPFFLLVSLSGMDGLMGIYAGHCMPLF